jgi:PhzF family phenazine biosynthesis protein
VQRYPFVIADVFTDALFSGNQLAVVTDARGLTPQQMQNIAREFNFAESTFVLPADAARARPAIRIFTPRWNCRLRAIRRSALRRCCRSCSLPHQRTRTAYWSTRSKSD